ncbi:MAG TPA: hypothetical protein VKC66_18370 [Xanthobacteraceae bacterium]|nr:hypothetical protein [Xanthobacteraceae bacterium]
MTNGTPPFTPSPERDAMQGVIDAQARTINTQATLIRLYQDLVLQMTTNPELFPDPVAAAAARAAPRPAGKPAN